MLSLDTKWGKTSSPLFLILFVADKQNTETYLNELYNGFAIIRKQAFYDLLICERIIWKLK